jgi:ABC-type transport system substrate-binding protein
VKRNANGSTPPPDGEREPARPQHHAHISRRSFLAGSALIAAGGAAAAVVGWARRDDRATVRVAGSSTTPTAVPDAIPANARGGTLRVYNFDASPYDALDPHLTQGGAIANVHSSVYSRLLRYADPSTGELAPDLAIAMPEQPDDTTFIFTIRDGVRFHETQRGRAAFPGTAGRLLTADDIRLSIERQRNTMSPQARRFFRRDALAAIDGVEVPDARTLIIKMREPLAPMQSLLAGRHAFVLPREVIDRSDEITSPDALIGTGPFMLDSFEERVAVRLKRNPDWFARNDAAVGSGRPFLDGCDAYFSPQEDVFQRASFERRIVDATGFVDQAELVRAHKTNLKDIALEETDAWGILGMRLLLDRPPFRDDRARRALHLAIDRAAIVEALYPAVDSRESARLSGPIAPGAERWALDNGTLLREPGYRTAGREGDVTEARGLWDAAMGGAPVDLRIAFAGLPRTIHERAVEAVRSQLQGALGVNVVSDIDLSGQVLIANAYRRNLEGATEGAITCGFAYDDGGIDLDEWLYPQFRSNAAMNSYRLQDPQLDALLDRQRREFDPEARRQIGLDAQEYLLANVNARIEICAPVERRLVWGYVRNLRGSRWYGETEALADVWLDESHPAFSGRLDRL